MEAASQYTPVDTTGIKRPKIYSEKDLETEIAKIHDILKDTCKFYLKKFIF